jgi:hypothetical protein
VPEPVTFKVPPELTVMGAKVVANVLKFELTVPFTTSAALLPMPARGLVVLVDVAERVPFTVKILPAATVKGALVSVNVLLTATVPVVPVKVTEENVLSVVLMLAVKTPKLTAFAVPVKVKTAVVVPWIVTEANAVAGTVGTAVILKALIPSLSLITITAFDPAIVGGALGLQDSAAQVEVVPELIVAVYVAPQLLLIPITSRATNTTAFFKLPVKLVIRVFMAFSFL